MLSAASSLFLGGLLVFAAVLGVAGLAIKPFIIDVAGLPTDRAANCPFAQPFAAGDAMRFSRRF